MFQVEPWAYPAGTNGTSVMAVVRWQRPVRVVPDHLCCLGWAIDRARIIEDFMLGGDPTRASRRIKRALRHIYDSRRGESPC